MQKYKNGNNEFRLSIVIILTVARVQVCLTFYSKRGNWEMFPHGPIELKLYIVGRYSKLDLRQELDTKLKKKRQVGL